MKMIRRVIKAVLQDLAIWRHERHQKGKPHDCSGS
jgi:hypothetical protein